MQQHFGSPLFHQTTINYNCAEQEDGSKQERLLKGKAQYGLPPYNLFCKKVNSLI